MLSEVEAVDQGDRLVQLNTAADSFVQPEGLHELRAVGEACGFAEFAIPFGSFENDFMGAGDGLYDVPIRSIWNAEARQTTHSAGFYASYMAKAMDALMGENRAFSRYADWHIGVMMLANDDAASYTTQQANAAALARDGVGFHNGGNDGDGSNWSRGTSGLGVEFHGHYGLNDTIRGEYDGDINYCAPNAFAQGDDLWCPLHYDALCDDRCD